MNGTSRRWYPLSAGLVALALVALSCRDQPARRVLLVTLDTVRADRLGAYGNPDGLTPVLDTLAREGAVFTNAAAHVPITTPSHASILTGLLPPTHGVRDNGTFALPETATTVTETLKAAGFATHAVLASFALDRRFGLAQGFDSYDDAIGAEHGLRAERSADDVVSRALAWFDQASRPTWFLWLHLYDAHHPYLPPAPLAERFAHAPYDGEIAFVDRELGRLFAELRRRDLWDDTLVVVVADHGEALGEHGERFHGTLLYDATVRVPLLVKWPGRGPRGRFPTSVGTYDIAPTILAATGLTSSAPSVPGRDLAALVRDPEAGRQVYVESLTSELHYGWSRLTALRTERFKLIRGARLELYDHVADPAESTDISRERDELAAGLASDLEHQEASGDGGGSRAIDPEAAEKLAALGYVSAGGSSAGARGIDPTTNMALENLLLDAMDLEGSEPERAAETYRALLSREPGMKIALVRLAGLEENRGNLEAALGHYATTLASYPDVEVAYAASLRILARLGRGVESLELARTAHAALPRSVELALDLADRERLHGERSVATRLVGEALAREPGNGRAHYLAATLAMARGDRVAAIAALRHAVGAGFPGDPRHLVADPTFATIVKDPELLMLIEDRARHAAR